MIPLMGDEHQLGSTMRSLRQCGHLALDVKLVFKTGTECYRTAKPAGLIHGGNELVFKPDRCPVWYQTGQSEAGLIPNRSNRLILLLLGRSRLQIIMAAMSEE
jgi:hypothetical protein